MIKLLGKNKYENDWNNSGINKCVHAFIGKRANGEVATVQTLPWNLKCWGVGSGRRGSFNDSAIQVEIMEDNLKSKVYFNKVYKEAIEFCVMICKKYNIPVENIVSHKESYEMGYGSNHSDPEYWFKKFEFTMDDFRKAVDEKLNGSTLPYQVKVIGDSLNIRKGPGTNYDKVGKITDRGVYTIIEVKGNWGLLKSNARWICLKGYTEKYKD
jgi:N-acetylmuramoyl-L-alanine amidase CwlA